MTEPMTLTFGSLFAGIGGFDLGFERAGMVCKWQVEIDDYCQKVLAKHWPEVKRYGDIRETGKRNLETVDVICGGFPCQPHSVAGKRKGASDDRDLWPEYRRIIAEMRPRWVVGENVPGIRTTILDQVLSDLEGMAYTVGTLIIPACAFDAPHRRERIFIIAHAHKDGKPSKSVDERREMAGAMDVADSSIKHAGRNHREKSSGIGLDVEQNALDKSGRDKSEHVTDPRSPHVGDAEGLTQRPGLRQKEPGGQRGRRSGNPNRWAVEPDVGRVAHGVPNRVDRLRTLGNAIVPQVAEWIGRRIVEVTQ